jgi:hypothetical protein
MLNEKWSDYFFETLHKKIGKSIFNIHYEFNKNFDFYFLKKINTYLDHEKISWNPNLTWDIVFENKDIRWDECYLSFNPGTNTRDFFENEKDYKNKKNHRNRKYFVKIDLVEQIDYLEYCEKTYDFKINYESLSKNPNITMKYVLDHIDKPWDFIQLSLNKSITIEDVLENLDKPWDFYHISSTKKITIDIIKKYSQLKWHFPKLSSNPNITWKDIINNFNIDWYYPGLSINQNITIDIVLDNIENPWCYYNLSKNPNITYDIIQKYPELPWDWLGYSQNPNLKLSDLDYLDYEKNKKDWDDICQNICYHPFDKDREEFYESNTRFIIK